MLRLSAFLLLAACESSSGPDDVVSNARIAVLNESGRLVIQDLNGVELSVLADSGLAASWSPTRKQLAFNRADALWLLDLPGKVSRLPTPGVAAPSWPEYSHDGRWIYFNGVEPDEYIFRIHPDGSGLVNISAPQTGSMPTVSPEGNRIAYVSNFRLVIHDLETGERLMLPASGGEATSPRWSPDGQWIAYVRNLSGGGLMLLRSDGSGLRQIGHSVVDPGITWSPDSRFILGTEHRGVLINIATDETTFFQWRGRYPAWRP